MTLEQLQAKLNEAVAAQNHNDCAVFCRGVLASAVDYIYEKSDEPKPKQATLLELLDGIVMASYVEEADIIHTLHYVRILGMNAEHGIKIRKKEAKLALSNITYFIGYIAAKEDGTLHVYQKPPYMSEAETRRLYIDIYLREAGWEVLEQDNVVLPAKACIEVEVDGMPNTQGKGYCDYVLYGRDGKPLAIVEVKKTSVSASTGRHQADLYVECMKQKYGYKPVIYYTNGYTTKIIDGIYPDRQVMAFHSIDELELLLQRRNRGDITDLTIKDEITNRPYQKIAITKICEMLNEKHRRGLIVMATGTGKTRLAISLVDVLTRNRWIKNVLFLADRTSLVNQAKRNFASLMPDMSICELSAGGEKDYNARLMFCTYQTMIHYIDAEDKRFTTGRFDLIIIDEAHRSIFNRYGTIFKYFDSLLIGLTATPKNEVDANTYRIFGCEAGIPDYDYSLEEAIEEKYLVGYHVINRTSKILTEGLDWSKLTPDQREQLDEYLAGDTPTPDFNIPGNEIFRVLFNKDTCRRVVEELMQWGLRVDNGETLGKTIIFAYNHKHADMIVKAFQELYPKYPPNTCQLVDYSVSYAEDLVIKFGTDDEFRIAVSVDMLDTGIDVPSILNLVFFKPVRSKIKFMQMIGRGTRLCENIYGPGRHKSGFQIFDYCGNFEYFGEHPEGNSPKPALTISQRLFQVRVDMLHELQRLEYQEQDWYRAYYQTLKRELHHEVVKIKNVGRYRIQVREEMQYVDKYYDFDSWTSLSAVMVEELKRHISPLLDSGLNGDPLSVAFDLRMYHIELALLVAGDVKKAASHVKNVRKIAQYLLNEKASVPQVLQKAADLKTLAQSGLWEAPEVSELERLRESLRDLMHLLKGESSGQYDIDIADEVGESGYEVPDTVIDIRTYREKVIDYLLEHSDSEVIRKIHNLEPITNEDLKSLERILWHELGSQTDYQNTTELDNLAAFVRSLIGLSQEAVNEKFGEYLSGNLFNSQQQEFVRTIITYVRNNGDIQVEDLVNAEPFNNFDLQEMFGVNLKSVVNIINVLHNSITVAA
ncbi:MAG: DEAD/DEAH box helicase family protein [Peptococcaceae bacterium]|nr:DEAD/DEAH box helicase family protein [Peptococcaceae bacterium]